MITKISHFTFFTLFFIFCVSAFSQENLSPQVLEKIEKAVPVTQDIKARINAVANNDIKNLALNLEAFQDLDHLFAYRIKTGDVTDQKSSGRCWLFTSLNVLRPAIMKKHNMKEFDFSQNYLFFYDQLEKSNRFLEAILNNLDKKDDDRLIEWLLKNPVDDGGVWNMMVDLIKKYGAIPREAMLESFSSENTRMMNRLLKRKLREGGYELRKMHQQGKKVKELREKKVDILSEVYQILLVCLGEPPKEFSWRYEDKDGNLSSPKIYTPQQFYKEFVGEDVEKYILMMDDPSKEYYKYYEIEYYRNVWEGTNWTFVNLPSDEMKNFAKESILSDQPMYFSCDVGKQLNTERGFLALNIYDYDALFGVKFGMDKKARILTFDSGSSHGMALMGIDTSETGKVTKWLLENSWGKDKGEKGYLSMTDEWLDEYMFRLVIHQDFVSEKVIEISRQKPVMLPPWDPMN